MASRPDCIIIPGICLRQAWEKMQEDKTSVIDEAIEQIQLMEEILDINQDPQETSERKIKEV